MQSQIKTTEPSPVNPPHDYEALNRLATKMSETAQALSELTQEISQFTSSTDSTHQDDEKEPDQIRCVRVPGSIVLEERETLEKYQAKDMADLISKAHNVFSMISLFMRLSRGDYGIGGFPPYRIGEIMVRPAAMLEKACSILAGYEPQNQECDESN